MSDLNNYWTRRAISRRAVLRTAAVGGGSLAAMGLIACSSSNTKNNAAKPSAAATGQATSAAASAAARSATAAGAAASPTPVAIDSTKGKPGGTLKAQTVSSPANYLVIDARTSGHFRGLCYSGLLDFNMGRPGLPGTSVVPEADLAQALPEQPDQVTYTFKLRPGVKFQNGSTLTADDVVYSYNKYANGDKSPWKTNWFWLDSVQSPDAQTIVVKTKGPFADAVLSMCAWWDAFIVAKAYDDTPDAATKPMGSGAFLYDSDNRPVDMTFKKYPDYFQKPYPYFDTVQIIVAADGEKRITDFISRNVDTTWWMDLVSANQINPKRPDAQTWIYQAPAFNLWLRTDQAPFNDARVRQALSMTIDRKSIRDSTYQGDGEDDQALSFTNFAWGFRKPSQLGAAAKYWTYDPQTAKQLLAAAGITKPIESTMIHLPPAVDGQAPVDMATLTQAKWKELGIANVADVTQQPAQYQASTNLGDYTGTALRPGGQFPVLGTNIKNLYWSPPGGVTVPTTNVCHVNDQTLSPLLEKQLTQLDANARKQIFAQIEQIIADQQYLPTYSTITQTHFADPSVKDIVLPDFDFLGCATYYKYWWKA